MGPLPLIMPPLPLPIGLACHRGVRAVIRDLCSKPPVDGRDQLRVGGVVANARAVRRWRIADGDLASAGAELRKSGPGRAVDLGRMRRHRLALVCYWRQDGETALTHLTTPTRGRAG